jgi:hypothetical protein
MAMRSDDPVFNAFSEFGIAGPATLAALIELRRKLAQEL